MVPRYLVLAVVGICSFFVPPKFLTEQNGVELGSLMIFDRAVRGRFGLLLGPKAPFWGSFGSHFATHQAQI